MLFKNKKNYSKLLTIVLFISMFVNPPSVNADGEFEFFNYVESPSQKALNPIVLDTSRTEKPVQNTNTLIPFNLRGDFNEADYFTSSAYEEPPPKQARNTKNTGLSPPEIRQEEFKPQEESKNFFAPSQDEGAVFATQKPPEVNYMASVDSYETDINLDGRIINSIGYNGLKTINEDVLSNHIKTKEGNIYNSEILQEDLQKIYSIGYFSDNMSVEPTLNPDGTVELQFFLEENLLVKDVEIVGNTVISTNELKPCIGSLKGLPQNLNEINIAIEKIQQCYAQKGYILANVGSVDDNANGYLVFNINEGIINEINISGNEKTKDYVIKRNILTQSGTIYNEEYLKKDLAKIYSCQIFDEVNREITPSEKNDGTYDITVVVKEKSTNSIGFGGGIDTGLGAFGSISLKEDNFLGRAQKLSLSGLIGSGILLSDASIKNHMNYQAELSFFEPHFINADNSLMSKLYFREMGSWNVPLAVERRIGLMAGIEHKIKEHENFSTTLNAGVEHINLKEGDFNKILSLYNKNHLDIAQRAKQLNDGFFFNLAPGIKYVNVDNKDIPREGIIAQAQYMESIGISDFDHTNGRLSGAVTKFVPVFKKSTFSLTGKAGIKIHGDEMPEVMAYKLGGPYSIRGFRMHGVGSGESFIMGSAELATPLPFTDRVKWDIIKNMRLTFFVDSGKVFDPTITNILYDRPGYALTAGVGLRFHIPGLGPISVDYGLPLLNPGNYGSEHGYVTFGSGGINGMYGY